MTQEMIERIKRPNWDKPCFQTIFSLPKRLGTNGWPTKEEFFKEINSGKEYSSIIPNHEIYGNYSGKEIIARYYTTIERENTTTFGIYGYIIFRTDHIFFAQVNFEEFDVLGALKKISRQFPILCRQELEGYYDKKEA